MRFVVSSIVWVSVNNIALWMSIGVDDWTAERAIIVVVMTGEKNTKTFCVQK